MVKSRSTLLLLVVAALSVIVAAVSLTVAFSFVFSQGQTGSAAQAPAAPTPELVSALPTQATSTPVPSAPQTLAVTQATETSVSEQTPVVPKEVAEYAIFAITEVCLVEKCDKQKIVRADQKTLLPADTADGVTASWCLAIQYEAHGCFEEKKVVVFLFLNSLVVAYWAILLYFKKLFFI